VKSIDRLTIVAQDRFQEILDSARNPHSAIYSLIREGITIEPDGERREVWVARPAAEIALAPRAGGAEESAAVPVQETIVFPTSADQAIAQTTLEVIRRVARPVTGAGLKSAADLNKPELLAQILQQVQQIVAPSQAELEGMGSEEQVRATVQKAVEMWVEKSMDIPRITLVPTGDTDFGYDDFDLDVAHIAFQPVSQDILLAYLRTDEREPHNADGATQKKQRLEDHIVAS